MITIIGHNLLWTSGWPVLIGIVVLLIIGAVWSRAMLIAAIGLFIFSVYFFRNPDRQCPVDAVKNGYIIAPADGCVIDITDDPVLTEGYARKISIFLSVWDVHVQWAPIDGRVMAVSYFPGAFFKAYLPKSAKENEHNDVVIESARGTLMMRQIAGLIARRICCWVKPGDELCACQKVGMIRFGSRVDLFVPDNAVFNVAKGDHVWGGQTVIARFV